MNKRTIFILLSLIFIVRLIFSLTTEFWWKDEDVIQIYLIGLKFFTTGQFPYFGPDLVYTGAQIPGALQAFLVSGLWFVMAIPEAPYFMVNIVVFAGLFLLGWYLRKRVPEFPPVLLWLMVFFTPWSVCYITRIVNPSFAIPGAVLFFIGIYEIYPQLRKGIIPLKLSFYMIGFGLFWIYQLHMSWVLLIPYIFFAFYVNFRESSYKVFLKNAGFFFLGCLTTALTVIPTFIKYGLTSPGGTSSTSVVQLQPGHLLNVFDYLIKILSYAAFDVTRFIGPDTATRIEFLKNYIWAAPAVVIVGTAGVVQVILMIFLFFNKRNPTQNWKAVKYFTLSLFLFVWFSSFFSVATPGGHTTLILLPPVMIIYGIQCFGNLMQKKYFKPILASVFVCAFIMYFAIGLDNYKNISIYKNRAVVVKALDQKDYRILGLRRDEKKVK